MRRNGRTQVNVLPSPQRMDFGHGNRRSNPGITAATSAAASTTGLALVSTQ